MNASLKAFFKEISGNKDLQKKLYRTKEISDVAMIANEQGFNISPAEILKAQAGRLIELAASNPEEAKIATAGGKPNLGAQWGREGSGFLDHAGYWFIQFQRWECGIQSYNPELINFLLQIEKNDPLLVQVNNCKTIDGISKIAEENGFKVSSIVFLVYQCLCILSLTDENADAVAHGRGAIF